MEFCQTQIGTVKGAVCKLEFRKVIICQVAIVKNAILNRRSCLGCKSRAWVLLTNGLLFPIKHTVFLKDIKVMSCFFTLRKLCFVNQYVNNPKISRTFVRNKKE
jgi:hypothetical protein